MAQDEFLLSIQDQNSAKAGRLAMSLSDFLRANVPEVDLEFRRRDADAMDFGATLALILGAPAAVALAKGVADWLRRHGDPAIDIETPDGRKIVVRHDLPAEAKREIILQALNGGAS